MDIINYIDKDTEIISHFANEMLTYSRIIDNIIKLNILKRYVWEIFQYLIISLISYNITVGFTFIVSLI